MLYLQTLSVLRPVSRGVKKVPIILKSATQELGFKTLFIQICGLGHLKNYLTKPLTHLESQIPSNHDSEPCTLRLNPQISGL